MKHKRHSLEQIIRKLRDADRMLSEGRTICEVLILAQGRVAG